MRKVIIPIALVLALIAGVGLGFAFDKDKAQRQRQAPEKVTPARTGPFSPASISQRPADLNDTRPNVVLMLVDDMRTADLEFMPKTQELLVESGVEFVNGISPNSVCCPARASLITAQYTHNNGVYTNKGLNGGITALRNSEDTLPVWLQAAGYNTAFFGKYLNGYGNAKEWPTPNGWNWWDATGIGTYAYTRFQFANNGDPQIFENDYITTRLRERSNNVMEKFAQTRDETGRPFFIFDSYVAPHGSIGAPKKDRRAVGNGPVPEDKYRESFKNLENPSVRKPSYFKSIKNVPKGWYKEVTRDEKKSRNLFLNRIRSLASVDDAVESTVAKLKELGQLENTVIIFTSDNGYLIGEHKLHGKTLGLQESVSVPMILSGGPFTGGEVSRSWATTVDVATTIASLADAKPIKRTVDGRELQNHTDQAFPPNDLQLIENGVETVTHSSEEPWVYQGFLLGKKYTYIKRPGEGEELYNNVNDPYQLKNVAGLARYSKLIKAFREQLLDVRGCSGVKECSGSLTVEKADALLR